MANCGRELGLFNGRAARHALRCGFAVARVARKNKSPGFSAEAFITLHLKPSPGRADRAHPGRHGHRRHHRGCPSCARHPAARLAGARIAARGNCAGVHRHRRRRTNAADARQSPDHRHRADASHGGLRLLVEQTSKHASCTMQITPSRSNGTLANAKFRAIYACIVQ